MGDSIGFRWWRDRIGLHVEFRITWRVTFIWVRHPAMTAWSGYFFRRRWAFRPINYRAIADYLSPTTPKGEA